MSANASITRSQAALFPVLIALSSAHLLNDMIQSLLPAVYPIIKTAYNLDFGQIGLITLTFQLTASIFQPAVGHYTDKRPMPYSMVVGMSFSLIGLIVLAYATSYELLLVGAGFVGIGSSIFHPEATRLARDASGGQVGLAQAIFQVGGQTGSAIGPLLAAFIIVPRGQASIGWFSLAALFAIIIMAWVGRWSVSYQRALKKANPEGISEPKPVAVTSRAQLVFTIFILMVLLFSKTAYSASFSSFYTFYLMGKFGVSMQTSQIMLFLFLVSSAAGALVGGSLGDRIGRNKIIWFSILGALPFTLILPYADLFWTGVLTILINLIMSSALASILIYAIELIPGRVGMIGGLFYGLAFGLGGLGAAGLGELADRTSIDTVYHVCSFLPAIGLLAWFLPKVGNARKSVGH